MKTKISPFPALSLAVAAMLVTLNAQLSIVNAQGTAFTYQGRLNDGVNAANGIYDLRFEIYDAASGGGTLAAPLTNSAVAVSNGLFCVTLDFGGGVLDGNPRWLDLAVRTNGGGAFTALSPRQLLTPTPYAVSAEKLSGTLPAGQLSGTLPSGSLAGAYGGAVTFNNSGNSFSGSGSGLTGLNASQLTGGTVADARLSANVARLNANQTFNGQNAFQNPVQMHANVFMNDQDIHFRSDVLHGVGWYGGGKLFAGVNVNGPVLYGGAGGALGAMSGTTNIALQWDGSQNVSVNGDLRLNARTFLNDHDLFLRGDLNHGLGWYGITKPFAGVSVDGPVLYGYSGGGLGTMHSGSNTNLVLTWNASGFVSINTTDTSGQLSVEGTTNTSNGLYVQTPAVNGNGLEARADNGGAAYGVWGLSAKGYGVVGSGGICGVRGSATNGVIGVATSTSGAGVVAQGATSNSPALRIVQGGLQVSGAGVGTPTTAFIHVATAANQSGTDGTAIDNPLCNGDPNAILIVTPNLTPHIVRNNHPIGVYYRSDTAKWVIFNQDAVAIPVNTAFNVLVIKN